MKALERGALAFDSETTSVDPRAARLVTAHAVRVGAKGAVPCGSWLVNPGVDIPAEATAIHGITTAKAQADGWAPADALRAITRELHDAWHIGMPVVIMNAIYDLTLLGAELARSGLPPLDLGPVLDPLVIDRALDPYRKGKRKLPDLAAHYGVRTGEAHSAEGDAITAARVVWKQLMRAPVLAAKTLEELMDWQRLAHRNWATGYQDYLRRTNPSAVVAAEWPVLP